MTHALMTPAMRATTTTMIVVGGAGDTMTARGITTVGPAITIGAHATMTGALVVNRAITIGAMTIDGTELW